MLVIGGGKRQAAKHERGEMVRRMGWSIRYAEAITLLEIGGGRALGGRPAACGYGYGLLCMAMECGMDTSYFIEAAGVRRQDRTVHFTPRSTGLTMDE